MKTRAPTQILLALNTALIAILGGLSPSLLHAQPTDRSFPRYELEVVGALPESLRVGDPVPLRIAGLKWKERKTQFALVPYPPAPTSETGSSELPAFTVVQDSDMPLTDQGEPLVRVAPLTEGEIAIPPLQVFEVDERGQRTQIAETQPLVLGKADFTLPENPEKEEDLKPASLYGALNLQWPSWFWIFGVVLGVALLAAFGFLGYWFWSKRKKKAISELSGPPLPEDEQALRELGSLEKQAYLSRRQFKPHYFGVSETLKKYLGNRYQFDAQEKTSGEILEELRVSGKAPHQSLQDLQRIFDTLDRVKFTDYLPEVSEGEQVLQDSRLWVKSTRRAPEVPSVEAGGEKR